MLLLLLQLQIMVICYMLLTCTWIKSRLAQRAVGAVPDIDAPIIDNLRAVAKSENKDIEDVVSDSFKPSTSSSNLLKNS